MEQVAARLDGTIDLACDDPTRPILLAAATFILSGVLMEPVGSGRPRRFIGDRRSSVTAAIAIGAAGVDSLPVDRGGGRDPRRRGGNAC